MTELKLLFFLPAFSSGTGILGIEHFLGTSWNREIGMEDNLVLFGHSEYTVIAYLLELFCFRKKGMNFFL